MDQALPVPVRGSTLTVDIKLEAAMNIMLYLNGANPTTGYDGDYIRLNPILKAKIPSLRMTGDDILGGQHIKCTLQLEEIVPKGMIDDEGNVVFSGVKLYVVGTAGKKITINKLEVTAVDPATLPPLPTYEYGADLMPTSPEKITPAQGVAGVEYHEDGSFTLFRDAKSSIAWPSVKVAVDRQIDLAATPLLRLEVEMEKGCANGHLYYTRADGSTGSVQLSKLVHGTEYDMTDDTDAYVDLAAYFGSEETITVNYITLSVYGNVGDSITWKSIQAAKLIPVEWTPPEVSTDESEEESEEESTEVSEESTDEPSGAVSQVPAPAEEEGMNPLWFVLIGVIVVALAVVIFVLKRK
jgi:hypothetical protein